ncbi:hypothetical protein MJ1_0533 [Nanobdella aerobiophila]|uniref:Uncharacterized protein n=1 Tax=Nanobdella aerobiophila TaxID=2586965 RepID=A0A915WS92_9ARCH|nr:hypothetical protein [Nanobdella aerobiophila]BBL45686.1 hypothetical protein MJ1_0533 [Nanobdella aerobiophila]
MSYDIEYEFQVPINVVKDIVDNYNSSLSFEEVLNNRDLLKRLLLNYIVNKYIYELEGVDIEKAYNNMVVEEKKKFFYVKIII